jgi:polyhydroxyalkanoate synthesis regulator phasin
VQTIQLQIDDDIYEPIKQQGIDLKAKVYELIDGLVDDGYPSISMQEAKKRVANAVERYRSGEGGYTSFDNQFRDEMNRYIESI